MNKLRYEKQTRLKGFGLRAQELLHNSKVLIVGAGGLGTPCAQYLNGVGVGTIGLVDEDIISLSNLPRQTLFDEAAIGLFKIDILSQKLAWQNPATNFICYKKFLTPDNALAIIQEFDVIVDASDNFGTRYLINDSCVLLNKPFIYGAVHEFEGHVSVLNYKGGPTYRCLFPESDFANDTILNCDENGVLGVLPALVGTYQAIEVIKIITNIGSPLSGQLLIIDTLSQSHFKMAVSANPENKKITQLKDFYGTPVCSNEVELIDANSLIDWIKIENNLQLIDVRTPNEFANGQWPLSKNIPLADLQFRLSEIDSLLPVVIICQTGVRSSQAAILLKKENSLQKVFSLQGGLSSLL